MSESFDESGTKSEPEVPVLPTSHVDGRKFVTSEVCSLPSVVTKGTGNSSPAFI